MSERVVPEKFAVMAVDPGGTSGVAQGLLRGDKTDSTRSVLARARRKNALRVFHVEAAEAYRGLARFDAVSQACSIYNHWANFEKRAMDMGVPYNQVFLVIEDFQLRQRSAELSPVEVTQALLALLAAGTIRSGSTAVGMGWPTLRPDHMLRFAPASEAKTYATNERLRSWGVWTVGHEHGRDATRHLCLAVSKILQGDWRDEVRS